MLFCAEEDESGFFDRSIIWARFVLLLFALCPLISHFLNFAILLSLLKLNT
jgi:hypothetical protein